MTPLRVLIVEDAVADAELIVRHLRDDGYAPEYERVENAEQMERALTQKDWEAVVCDSSLPAFSGAAALDLLRRCDLDIPFIVCSAATEATNVVRFIKAGAHDYIPKNKLGSLAPAMRRELQAAAARRDARRLSSEVERQHLRLEQLQRRAIDAADAVLYEREYATERYAYMGERIEALTGFTASEMTPQLWDSLVIERYLSGPLSGFSFEEAIQKVRTGAVPQWHCDCLIRTRAGETRWITDASVEMRDAMGNPIGSVGTLQDITSRKRTETDLRESRAALEEAQQVAHLGSWTSDRKPNASLVWSSEVYRIFGRSETEFDGTLETFLGLIHPGDRAKVEAASRAALQAGTAYDLDHRIVRPDGTVRWVHERGEVIRDAQGQPIRLRGIVQDITERKLAEERIREQAHLIELVQDAIVVTNLEGQPLFANPAAQRLTGWSLQEWNGRSVRELYRHPAEFDAAVTHLQQHGAFSGEICLVPRNGKEIYVDSRWTLLRDQSGNPSGILGINTDLTERKKLEMQFVRAQRLEAIGTLASGVAHDLNNLLAPILMVTSMLREKPLSLNLGEVTEMIENNARRAADIVEQLLAMGRGGESRRLVIHVRHVIRDLARLIGATFPRGIKLEQSIPTDLWAINADPTHIHQVLLNLCLNARDAMGEHGVLSVAAQNISLDESSAALHPGAKVGPYIFIEVADTGTGIPPEALPRIFDPFFTTKSPGKGSGLGLATAASIANNHGGFMTVHTVAQKGTAFRLYLPAIPDQKAAPPPVEPAISATGQGELILLADDEKDVRDTLRRVLQRNGYRVLIADDGTQALMQFVKHRNEVALLITDLNMPAMGGVALIGAIRGLAPTLPVIISSGLHFDPNSHAGARSPEAMHVQIILTKPYDANTLLTAVQSALSQKL